MVGNSYTDDPTALCERTHLDGREVLWQIYVASQPAAVGERIILDNL
jgi:hypothetical protein